MRCKEVVTTHVEEKVTSAATNSFGREQFQQMVIEFSTREAGENARLAQDNWMMYLARIEGGDQSLQYLGIDRKLTRFASRPRRIL